MGYCRTIGYNWSNMAVASEDLTTDGPRRLRAVALQGILRALVVLLVLKVTATIVAGYGDYFPANFASDFLWRRESHFVGMYRVAFYAHIVSGPISLLMGLILISARLREWAPQLHRSLGKVQAALVLFILAPSGLWMAFYAERVAAEGFVVLAMATGLCVALGWRAAVQRRMAEHRRWMWRCFLLLCSAIVLRLMGGLSVTLGVGGEWSYPLAAWVSWLGPLVLFEWWERRRAGRAPADRFGMGGRTTSLTPPKAPSAASVQLADFAKASSLPAIEMSARR
jgi:hypothetical protein